MTAAHERRSPISVSGGSGGIAANGAELIALAGGFGAAAADADDTRAQLRFWLVGPFGDGPAGALLGSPLGLYWPDLDPQPERAKERAAAQAAARVAADAALDELAAVGSACDRVRQGLVRAVLRYRDTDSNVLDQLRGLGHAVTVGEATLLATRDAGRAAQAALTDDPDTLYLAAGAAGSAGDLRLAELAAPDDGDAVAIATGVDTAGVAARPPRLLSDLIDNLARRNDDPRHGTIDVRVLTMPGGARKAIVDITGTKRWDPRPSDDVTDPQTNVRALAGRRTAYERGVLTALHDAGVTSQDDVMLVGHSLGGMIAVNAAARAARTGEFRVTHVVTAGAPIGATVARLPRATQVLALEDVHDIVPAADGRANPDLPNVTTVRSRHGDATVGGDHHLRTSYLPAAVDVQDSHDRSARHALAGMHGYFGASSVVTHTYQIRRG